MREEDGYRKSNYMYKDRNGKLCEGPLWDDHGCMHAFDWAGFYGNDPDGTQSWYWQYANRGLVQQLEHRKRADQLSVLLAVARRSGFLPEVGRPLGSIARRSIFDGGDHRVDHQRRRVAQHRGTRWGFSAVQAFPKMAATADARAPAWARTARVQAAIIPLPSIRKWRALSRSCRSTARGSTAITPAMTQRANDPATVAPPVFSQNGVTIALGNSSYDHARRATDDHQSVGRADLLYARRQRSPPMGADRVRPGLDHGSGSTPARSRSTPIRWSLLARDERHDVDQRARRADWHRLERLDLRVLLWPHRRWSLPKSCTILRCRPAVRTFRTTSSISR